MNNLNIESYISAIDNKNTKEIEEIIKSNNENNEIDIIFELYTYSSLTPERLHFIMKNCLKYFKNIVNSNESNEDNINIINVKFLVDACKNGNGAIVKYLEQILIKKVILVKHHYFFGADINKEDKDSETPLFNAFRYGNEALVKYLVEHGADINKESRNGETQLFKACYSENEALVKCLVELGADINKFDYTPLYFALKCRDKKLREYLKEMGVQL